MILKIGTLPGLIREVALEDSATIGDALSVADLSAEGYEIRRNGSPAETGEIVSDGDTILLVKQVKGN